MGIFSSESLQSMDDLLLQQMRDLYDAEHQITSALPKMVEKAASPELEKALQTHLSETKGQITRLETAFDLLGQKAKRHKCKAIAGLIEEGEEMLEAEGPDEVVDAGLIAAAQRIEHYEMAGYGCARNFARRLGHSEVARLLEETLEEEKGADSKLTKIAEAQVNPAAQAAA